MPGTGFPAPTREHGGTGHANGHQYHQFSLLYFQPKHGPGTSFFAYTGHENIIRPRQPITVEWDVEIQPNPTLRHAFPLENTVWRIPVATRGDATLPLIYPGNSAPPGSPALQLVKEGYTAAAAGKRPISLPRQDFLHVHGSTFSRYGP